MPDSPKLTDVVPTDALKNAGSTLLSLIVQRAAEAATNRVTSLTDRLDGVAENGGTGLRTALRGRSDDDDGDDHDGDDEDDENGGSEKGGGFFSGLKDKISGLFGGGGGGGGGKKLKVTQIVEDHDIGLPLRTTYDLWTQFGDFASFMKKVENVDQTSDEKSTWKAQIFLSHREWEATIIEQVPDSHIVWRSTGAKGHVDGAVTFTSLGPNLTKVCLVLEYYPQGLFERTGNIWRAQGRRARLEFQHFKRHAMVNVLVRQDEVEGWRGEIRDSEVVKTHEEALEEEDRAREDDARPADDELEDDVEYADEDVDEDAEAEEDYDDEPEDDADYADEDEPADEEPVDDEPADDEPVDEEPADEEPAEADYREDDEFEDEQDDVPEDEPEEAPRRGRRRPVASGARGRG